MSHHNIILNHYVQYEQYEEACWNYVLSSTRIGDSTKSARAKTRKSVEETLKRLEIEKGLNSYQLSQVKKLRKEKAYKKYKCNVKKYWQMDDPDGWIRNRENTPSINYWTTEESTTLTD